MAEKRMQTARKGNPVIGLTMTEDEIELIDTYRIVRGLQSRSAALREMVRFSFGYNERAIHILSELSPLTKYKHLLKKAQSLRKQLVDAYRAGRL